MIQVVTQHQLWTHFLCPWSHTFGHNFENMANNGHILLNVPNNGHNCILRHVLHIESLSK